MSGLATMCVGMGQGIATVVERAALARRPQRPVHQRVGRARRLGQPVARRQAPAPAPTAVSSDTRWPIDTCIGFTPSCVRTARADDLAGVHDRRGGAAPGRWLDRRADVGRLSRSRCSARRARARGGRRARSGAVSARRRGRRTRRGRGDAPGARTRPAAAAARGTRTAPARREARDVGVHDRFERLERRCVEHDDAGAQGLPVLGVADVHARDGAHVAEPVLALDARREARLQRLGGGLVGRRAQQVGRARGSADGTTRRAAPVSGARSRRVRRRPRRGGANRAASREPSSIGSRRSANLIS